MGVKKLCCLFILFFIFACTRIELATNWADTYITRQIDHYFDINSIQSHFIKNSLKVDIQNIRTKIYPRIADEFSKIQKEVDDNEKFNLEMINAHEVELRNIFYSALGIFENSAVSFSAQLTPDQLAAFNKEFQKQTTELRKDVKDETEAKDKRFDKVKKQLEGWIGSLSRDQKKDLKAFCEQNVFPLKEQILNREKLAAGFNENFSDLEKRKKYVSDLFLNYESLRESNYARVVIEDQNKLFTFIAQFLNRLTPDQRKNLHDNLLDRIEQLRNSAKKNAR